MPKISSIFRKRSKHSIREVDPDEIFLDSKNLPSFDTDRLEGHIEYALSKRAVAFMGGVFALIAIIFFGRSFFLQVAKGDEYAIRSTENHLRETPILAERGTIRDRNGVLLAWNTDDNKRAYIEKPGFGHLLGFVGLPDPDDTNALSTERIGKAGIEKEYNDFLRGTPGLRIEEVNAKGQVASEHEREHPEPGKTLTLSIDAGVQETLYKAIENFTKDRNFRAGAGAIMDITTGELLAITSFPEFSSSAMSAGNTEAIAAYQKDTRTPFLNRAVSGLYTPGSIMKPYVALGALEEKIISPTTQILSTGSISIPNPYNPDKSSVFNDWKAHGYVDMREALAVSSDVYFYVIGGGFKDQKGIGISNIEKYSRLFGFGTSTGSIFIGEESGTIPTPSWKEKFFPGEPWRLGDTYNTSIGQYGYQVTVLQMVRAVAALANGGKLYVPTVKHESSEVIDIQIEPASFKVVQEGMRQGALPGGTAATFASLPVSVAAKTGTAELGVSKQYVNSWTTGFFPYENPRYAFAIVTERGPRDNTVGASAVMKYVLEWMSLYTSEHTR